MIPIEFTARGADFQPLEGKEDILLSVRRTSDDEWLDWSDLTFKDSGWTLRQIVMSEIDSALAPGDYRVSFNLASVTNKVDEDTYTFYVEQNPGTDVKNLPANGSFSEKITIS